MYYTNDDSREFLVPQDQSLLTRVVGKFCMIILCLISITALAVACASIYHHLTSPPPVPVPKNMIGEVSTLSPWVTWIPASAMEHGLCTDVSVDSAGSVQGIIRNAGAFMIQVHFGQGFPAEPKSVSVTSAQSPPPNDLTFGLWAHNLNEEGFTVGGWFKATEGSVPTTLFYYQVV